jgi:hypothetical protein
MTYMGERHERRMGIRAGLSAKIESGRGRHSRRQSYTNNMPRSGGHGRRRRSTRRRDGHRRREQPLQCSAMYENAAAPNPALRRRQPLVTARGIGSPPFSVGGAAMTSCAD